MAVSDSVFRSAGDFDKAWTRPCRAAGLAMVHQIVQGQAAEALGYCRTTPTREGMPNKAVTHYKRVLSKQADPWIIV